MTIQEFLGDRRDELLRLASRHGAYDVRVIGSVARGEASPQSDLDLLVRWSDSALSTRERLQLFIPRLQSAAARA